MLLITKGIVMPYPRYKQIDLQQTQYYHVVSRCVRRSYLCGFDQDTGESYEHRKDWVERRLLYLTNVFSIDVLAYAVMSNHYHVVVDINDNIGCKISDSDVVKRWHKVSSGTPETVKFAEAGILPTDDNQKSKLRATIQEYRRRLCDLSWFMKLLNGYIARQANKEDDCTGHFWEGRFKSQALIGISAVLSCMVYVDLNPFRAGIVDIPENAFHTSLNKRYKALKQNRQPRTLLPFSAENAYKDQKCIPYSLENYLQLVKDTSMISKQLDKPLISQRTKKSLQNLGLCSDQWCEFMAGLEELFPVALGSFEQIEAFKKATGRTRMRAGKNALKLYLSLGHKPH